MQALIFQVSIIRTESEGQAKDIMEIMADADAVLVAGGDGTIMEAVTGLMKRADRTEAARVPIGILPVRKTNSFAHSLFGLDEEVKLMGEATMSVIRHLKKRLSRIEVQNRSEDKYFRGKKIHCVNRVEVGAWKDVLWDCDLDIKYLEDSDNFNGTEIVMTEPSSHSQKSNQAKFCGSHHPVQ